MNGFDDIIKDNMSFSDFLMQQHRKIHGLEATGLWFDEASEIAHNTTTLSTAAADRNARIASELEALPGFGSF